MLKKAFSMLRPTVYPRRLMSLQNSSGTDWMNQKQKLMEPLEYIKKMPAYHFDLTSSAFNHWVQASEDQVKDINNILKTFVAWSILTDDIQDSSVFRYGVPAAHQVFGVGLTINAACYGLIEIGQNLNKIGPKACDIFYKHINNYLYGQACDLYWRDNNIWPTEEEYVEMAKKRIGSASALIVELMQMLKNTDKDYIGLAVKYGAFYALIDDYYNLFQPNALQKFPKYKRWTENNYVAGNDIAESKITLPVIHAMQFPDVASELAGILKLRTSDPRMHSRVISLLKQHGSDEHMRDLLKKLEAEIRTEIEQLGGNPKLIALIDDLNY